MRDQETFLEKYRTLEQTLREYKAMQVKDFEDTLSPAEADKLRVCRNIRNFLSHQPEASSFIAVTPQMIQFLQNYTECVNPSEKPVSKIMIPINKGFSTANLLSDAVIFLTKKKVSGIPVFDKTGTPVGLLNESVIYNAIKDGLVTKTTKISALPLAKITKSNCDTYSVHDPVKYFGAHENVVGLVVDDNGNYVGFLPR